MICYAFRTRTIATKCTSYVLNTKTEVSSIRLEEVQIGTLLIYTCHVPCEVESRCHEFFQLSGECISPRLAKTCLKAINIFSQETIPCSKVGVYHLFREPTLHEGEFLSLEKEVKRKLRDRVATFLTPDKGEDVYLFGTGMAALYNGLQLCLNIKGRHRSICMGLPYKDAYRMFCSLGEGCILISESDDLKSLEDLAEKERISVVFCEFPSNPLLRSPDLMGLRKVADKYEFLIMVDVTLSNFINLKGLNIADIIVMSLTKVFSGYSHVMGGCLIISQASKSYPQLKRYQTEAYEDTLWCEDAYILERNSRDLFTRATNMNASALKLANLFHESALISRVNYPRFTTADRYAAFLKRGGGFGSIMSIEFHHKPTAIKFYDALHLPKGMSIGANFTLVAPFTVLAYPEELDFAAQNGIGSHLIRISVGLEPYPTLEAEVMRAMNAVTAS
ncbi:Cystathionine gamma-synthase [Massospora cicadina]|nr:Cystathionine gamma-synthase [Massospora cicadina]